MTTRTATAEEFTTLISTINLTNQTVILTNMVDMIYAVMPDDEAAEQAMLCGADCEYPIVEAAEVEDTSLGRCVRIDNDLLNIAIPTDFIVEYEFA